MKDTIAKTPCRACPSRRESAPGWLGNSTPDEFIGQAEAELRMPCHLTVDYEDEDWAEKLDANGMVQCAGRATYFANRCKLPRNQDLLIMPANREEFFYSAE